MEKRTNPLSDEYLGKILEPFKNNEDFVDGVLTVAEHEDDRKVLLDFIKKGVNVNANSILELSYHLRCVRDGEPEYRFMKSSFNHFE